MRIACTIRGLSPLIMNRFTDDAEVSVSSGLRLSMAGSRGAPRERAKQKAYMDADENLYIPGTNIFAAIIQAGVFHKVGKNKLTTMRSSLIPAGLIVTDLICPLKCSGWEVDSRSVVIPSTGGRIMAHRPRIDEWETTFNMDVDADMFNEQSVRLLVGDAGKKIGLGDFRPARKGPYGRFSVTGWEVTA